MAKINDPITTPPASDGEDFATRMARKKAQNNPAAIPSTSNVSSPAQTNAYTPSNLTTPVVQTTFASVVQAAAQPEVIPIIAPEIHRVPMRPPVVPATIPVRPVAPVAKSATSPVAPPHLGHKVTTMSSNDTVVLPPDFKGVFVSDSDGRGHGRGYGYDSYGVAERVKDSQVPQTATIMGGISANHVAIEKGTFAGVVATEKSAAAVGVAVEKNGRSSELAVEKTAAATALAVEKTAAASQLTIEKTASAVAASAAAGFAQSALNQSQGFAATQLQGVKFAGEVAVQNTMNAAAAALASSTTTASILLGQTKYAGEQALTACHNQAAVLAAISACCCEQSKLVLAQSNEVKALINSQDARRADRELVAAQQELALLKYCRGPHMPPFPPVA